MTLAKLWYRTLIVVLFAAVSSWAQQSTQAPSIPSTGFPGLDQYRASRIAVFTDDYGQLARYRGANEKLGQPAAGENRVVFFGDSITDMWNLPDYFPGRPYVNRGIGGQTTPQMLVRFRQDVIDLQPKVVVILAGTNDIAGNTGPMRNEDIEANYASFAELARVHGIRVVYSSILPVHNYTERSKDFFAQRPQSRILELNQWLKDYCTKNDIVYLDYFSALVDDNGMMKKNLADDGLHPNAAGYKIMAQLAEAAIDRAMKESPKSSAISIELEHGSEAELKTRQQLQKLLDSYDLRKYTFTHAVVIDEKSIPHSHPVLTLHTRHLNSDDELLSTYVHEQLHWFLDQHLEQTQAAEDELRKVYPKVPFGNADGARDEESTYLHLITCYLEMIADRKLMGKERTAAAMNFWAGDHYRWIYKTVMQDESKIGNVVTRHHLQIG
jgi:lysophospholipase L1-like esterase